MGLGWLPGTPYPDSWCEQTLMKSSGAGVESSKLLMPTLVTAASMGPGRGDAGQRERSSLFY